MDKFFLIYVNVIGKNYEGKYLYEFIFSDTIKNIDGEDWDALPASGRPEPPHEKFIKKVGNLETEVKLDTVQHSDSFAVWDALDGIIALAWENIDDYDTAPNKRLVFNFGDPIKKVEDTLYEKDLILNYKNKTHGATK